MFTVLLACIRRSRMHECTFYASIQAPGDCLWEDVCHFIDPFLNIYEDYHIRELMEKSRSLPFQLQYRLLSPDFLGLLVSEWRTFPDVRL